MSSTAAACPKCGAKPKKKTGILTWIIGGVFGVSMLAAIVSSNDASNKAAEAKAARTPEQVAQDEKKEAAFQRTVAFGKAVKSALREPKSVEWDVINANADASVICMQYRARNGFGGMSTGTVVHAGGKVLDTAKAWNKHCVDKEMTNFRNASVVI